MDNLNSEVSVSSEPVSTAKPVVQTPVDFIKLQKANPDIYAWINIPGTVIDYPVLQRSDDNSYYLNHTVEGKKSVYGSIYTENYNNRDFSDFNTVIYGHNMLNGTMFAGLKKFRDQKFFDTNKYINIYLPGRILKYQIFAAHVYDDRHLLLNFDFTDKEVCKSYLDTVKSGRALNTHIDSSLDVTENDRIVTLSTCTNKKSERYLVQGVMIYDSEKQ